MAQEQDSNDLARATVKSVRELVTSRIRSDVLKRRLARLARDGSAPIEPDGPPTNEVTP